MTPLKVCGGLLFVLLLSGCATSSQLKLTMQQFEERLQVSQQQLEEKLQSNQQQNTETGQSIQQQIKQIETQHQQLAEQFRKFQQDYSPETHQQLTANQLKAEQVLQRLQALEALTQQQQTQTQQSRDSARQALDTITQYREDAAVKNVVLEFARLKRSWTQTLDASSNAVQGAREASASANSAANRSADAAQQANQRLINIQNTAAQVSRESQSLARQQQELRAIDQRWSTTQYEQQRFDTKLSDAEQSLQRQQEQINRLRARVNTLESRPSTTSAGAP